MEADGGLGPGMVEGGSRLLHMVTLMNGRFIDVLLLALLACMRALASVVHIVIPYSIVSRQRASDTWVPPERTALDGRRSLDGENLVR